MQLHVVLFGKCQSVVERAMFFTTDDTDSLKAEMIAGCCAGVNMI
jgi:hypothetical protein